MPRPAARARAIKPKSPPAPAARSAQAAVYPQNIRAAQAVYFASLFEYLTAFRVVDLLIQAYKRGKLRALDAATLGLLQRYADGAKGRLSEQARRDLYTRVLGIPGGREGVSANNEFAELWLAFIKATTAYAKKVRSELAHHKTLDLLEQAGVRDAAHSLAANLSAHGAGEAFGAAAELHKQVTELATILSEPGLQQAYGATDMWQLIERVAHLEWGQGADAGRYRAMASAAGVIMAWLAKNAARLWRPASVDRPNLHLHPTDAELILECQRWLEAQETSVGGKRRRGK